VRFYRGPSHADMGLGSVAHVLGAQAALHMVAGCATYGCRLRYVWLQVRFYREVELKHCRVGMLAAVGFVVRSYARTLVTYQLLLTSSCVRAMMHMHTPRTRTRTRTCTCTCTCHMFCMHMAMGMDGTYIHTCVCVCVPD
jgi:hypothetical protein